MRAPLKSRLGGEPFEARAVFARARGVVARDDELGRAAELFVDQRRGAQEVILTFNFTQLADDADSEHPPPRDARGA